MHTSLVDMIQPAMTGNWEKFVEKISLKTESMLKENIFYSA